MKNAHPRTESAAAAVRALARLEMILPINCGVARRQVAKLREAIRKGESVDALTIYALISNAPGYVRSRDRNA